MEGYDYRNPNWACQRCGALVHTLDTGKHDLSHAELKYVLQTWADMLDRAEQLKAQL